MQHVGPYVLGRTLGTGQSAKVKLGIHQQSGEKVAIKVIKKEYLSSQPSLKIKVEREIAVLRLIQHRHVLHLIDVYETSRHLFMVMEYVVGGELFDYLVTRGQLEHAEALVFFQQIMAGLDCCHAHLICHRDLKPENLLLDANKQIKIADFGMASLNKKGSLLSTSCGSPHYASPEVVQGIQYNGFISDIWSCGVILFALLTGKLPFDDENIRRLLQKVKAGVFHMPSHLPHTAQDLIRRMIAVDPMKRITIPGMSAPQNGMHIDCDVWCVIVEIREHPWFRSNLPSIGAARPAVDDVVLAQPIEDVDMDLLNSLASLGFGCDGTTPSAAVTGVKQAAKGPPREKRTASIMEALRCRFPTLEKVYYHLYSRKQMMEGRGTGMDMSSVEGQTQAQSLEDVLDPISQQNGTLGVGQRARAGTSPAEISPYMEMRKKMDDQKEQLARSATLKSQRKLTFGTAPTQQQQQQAHSPSGKPPLVPSPTQKREAGPGTRSGLGVALAYAPPYGSAPQQATRVSTTSDYRGQAEPMVAAEMQIGFAPPPASSAAAGVQGIPAAQAQAPAAMTVDGPEVAMSTVSGSGIGGALAAASENGALPAGSASATAVPIAIPAFTHTPPTHVSASVGESAWEPNRAGAQSGAMAVPGASSGQRLGVNILGTPQFHRNPRRHMPDGVSLMSPPIVSPSPRTGWFSNVASGFARPEDTEIAAPASLQQNGAGSLGAVSSEDVFPAQSDMFAAGQGPGDQSFEGFENALGGADSLAEFPARDLTPGRGNSSGTGAMMSESSSPWLEGQGSSSGAVAMDAQQQQQQAYGFLAPPTSVNLTGRSVSQVSEALQNSLGRTPARWSSSITSPTTTSPDGLGESMTFHVQAEGVSQAQPSASLARTEFRIHIVPASASAPPEGCTATFEHLSGDGSVCQAYVQGLLQNLSVVLS